MFQSLHYITGLKLLILLRHRWKAGLTHTAAAAAACRLSVCCPRWMLAANGIRDDAGLKLPTSFGFAAITRFALSSFNQSYLVARLALCGEVGNSALLASS